MVTIQIGTLPALGGSPASGYTGGAVLGAGNGRYFKGMIVIVQGAELL